MMAKTNDRPKPIVTTEARTFTPTSSSALNALLPYGNNKGQRSDSRQFGIAQQHASILSGILPETYRPSAYSKDSTQAKVLGSDASLSVRPPDYVSTNQFSDGAATQQFAEGNTQQASSLSWMLPETYRPSAYEIQYKEQSLVGSDASFSPSSTLTTQQASTLSWMLPEKQRTSAYEAQYKEQNVVGSDASLSPSSTTRGNQYYDDNYEYETVGPKTSPMLDWFQATKSNPDASYYSNSNNENDSSNNLSDIASYYTPTPTLRTNDSFGKYSANIGQGRSSNAMGFSRGEGIRQKGTALYMVGAGFGSGPMSGG